jgi:hypothetical protein
MRKEGAVYEITVCGAPPPDLTARFPAITLHTSPAATVLSKQISDPAEVDELTEQLRSLGIALLEVRVSPRRYEFRIEGRLGRSILRYLHWAFRLEKERTVIRVATHRELRMVLEQLAESGTQIDHCIRRSAA